MLNFILGFLLSSCIFLILYILRFCKLDKKEKVYVSDYDRLKSIYSSSDSLSHDFKESKKLNDDEFSDFRFDKSDFFR